MLATAENNPIYCGVLIVLGTELHLPMFVDFSHFLQRRRAPRSVGYPAARCWHGVLLASTLRAVEQTR